MDLPKNVQAELIQSGLDKLLNQFSEISGPNCFAATAGALKKDETIFKNWIHWPEFKQLLILSGFEITNKTPQAGDVLIFSTKEMPIHAAYFLGNGFYFEKPGQDFYEPYRIANFQDWQVDWPGTNVSVWRKKND